MKIYFLALPLILFSCQQRSASLGTSKTSAETLDGTVGGTPTTQTESGEVQNRSFAGGGSAGPSSKVRYRPVGSKGGGFQTIREAKWPNVCVKGDVVNTNGPLFPFNENQTLVVRGPLIMTDLSVYNHQPGNSWTRISDLGNLGWNEESYGTIRNLGAYPFRGKNLENGREVFAPINLGGDKLVVMRVQMPYASAPPAANKQNDMPAIWLLNSRIFAPPSAQYFCNCRGLGNPGGCGEIDIAEIIPGNRDRITTTIYSYEGAVGGVLPSGRPANRFLIYAAILRNDGGVGEVNIVETDSFDFSQAVLSEDFVSKAWLGGARVMNPNAERLNPP